MLHWKSMAAVVTCIMLVVLLAAVLEGKSSPHKPQDQEIENKPVTQVPQTLTKKLIVQHDMEVDATLTLAPDLKLTIGEQERTLSKAWLDDEGLVRPPVMDMQVIEQDERTNRIILISAAYDDPDYETSLQLWAIEYFDNGTLIPIWELSNEEASVSYGISSGGVYEFHLNDPRYTMLLDIDEHEYERLEQNGDRIGKLDLSPPIEMLLDDVVFPGQQDILVRRKVVGEKPEWLPFDEVVSVFFAQRGNIKELRRYTLNNEPFYSINDLQPQLQVEQVESETGTVRIQLNANSKIDRDSLEHTLATAITSNVWEKQQIQSDITWHTDEQADILFHLTEAREVFVIDWQEINNWLGRNYQVRVSPDSSSALRDNSDMTPFITIDNVATGIRNFEETEAADQLYLVVQVGAGKRLLMVHGNKHSLMNLDTPTDRTPVSWESEHYARGSVFYPNRFFAGTNYVVKSLRTIYRYDAEGKRSVLWEAPAAIFGWAVSPNGERIAVLYSEDEFNGPYADLAVIDHQGELKYHVEKAGYYNKSDGVIPFVDMQWTDNTTLDIPTNLHAENRLLFGSRIYSFASETPVVDEMLEEFPGADRISEVIHRHHGLEDNTYIHIKMYPSPDLEYVIYVHHGLWLYNTLTKEHRLLGNGHFIGWVDHERAVWYENYSPESPVPKFIF